MKENTSKKELPYLIEGELKERLDQLKERLKDEVVVICIDGPIGSGKTFLGRQITEYLGKKALFLSTDTFITVLRETWADHAKNGGFRLVEWYDRQKIKTVVHKVREGRPFTVSGLYDITCGRTTKTMDYDPADCRLIIIEGLFALHDDLREEADLGIYITAPPEIAVERTRYRDMYERNTKDEVWRNKMKIYHEGYIPYKDQNRANADIILENS